MVFPVTYQSLWLLILKAGGSACKSTVFNQVKETLKILLSENQFISCEDDEIVPYRAVSSVLLPLFYQ